MNKKNWLPENVYAELHQELGPLKMGTLGRVFDFSRKIVSTPGKQPARRLFADEGDTDTDFDDGTAPARAACYNVIEAALDELAVPLWHRQQFVGNFGYGAEDRLVFENGTWWPADAVGNRIAMAHALLGLAKWETGYIQAVAMRLAMEFTPEDDLPQEWRLTIGNLSVTFTAPGEIPASSDLMYVQSLGAALEKIVDGFPEEFLSQAIRPTGAPYPCTAWTAPQEFFSRPLTETEATVFGALFREIGTASLARRSRT